MIFQKLFKKNRASDDKAEANRRKIVARAPRVRIHALHDIRLDITSPLQAGGVLIGNISSSGVGILTSDNIAWPPAGTLLSGILFVGKDSFEIKMRVAHISSSLVGCQYEKPPAGLAEAVGGYFQVELNALSMFRVSPDLLRPDIDGQPYLYRGEESGELFFVESKGQIRRFSFSFLGNYLEWSEGNPLRFGFMVGNANLEVTGEHIIDPIQWASVFPPEMAQVAIRFLENLETLKEDHRKALASMLKLASRGARA